jgi:hypothetical protein
VERERQVVGAVDDEENFLREMTGQGKKSSEKR